ncbi:MAG: [protein-PII] uridylyltransferase [Bacteroidota bacterium]|nr:[protein-PII] uridylyltransferase [Bacteroidota bacterium]MDP4190066.1 [protein-PII] uridylyltransferase [Bacteroidota bacterium]MDP4196521.1 [protein-PII] uridylyltransferase [Bacteroidota bacterium]
MIDTAEIKKEFLSNREKLFKNPQLHKDAFKFCVAYSLLVEENILRISGMGKLNFALASAGSFSRRELSPYSDIDLMFIVKDVEENQSEIENFVRMLWDCGIEVSHTVRDFFDIEKFLNKDLHAFTQFFETRFLLGSERVYQEWNDTIFSSIKNTNVEEVIYDFFADIQSRYAKYGRSAKTLEPNVKFSAGGLRDLHAVEWMYSLKNKTLLTEQAEVTQAESFINRLRKEGLCSLTECKSVLESYKFILNIRNILHLISKQRNDRLEFNSQQKIARFFNYKKGSSLQDFMKQYFKASNTINRFSKTMVRRFDEEITHPLSEFLAMNLDDDFILKGNTLSTTKKDLLTLSDILRAFYYRGLYSARFDEGLRSLTIESISHLENSEYSASNHQKSSAFFREILRLNRNVGETLVNMNELGVLHLLLPEFRDLVGFFQAGVYHNYTADEHTLVAITNVENLYGKENELGRLYTSLKEKEILYLAIMFHDIAKPISVSGHEIIGAEIASSVMYRLGYEEKEVSQVSFLVQNHLVMEQIAFRRNLSDPETLNNFTSRFSSVKELDLLYLLTYADLSAVNPVVWTEWKSDLLAELYRKSRAMLVDQITGEELLFSSVINFPQKSLENSDSSVQEHIDSIDDISYTQHFTEEEIMQHLKEIEKGLVISVFFKELNVFTNITIIAKDSPSLLSKLCGVLSVNDLNIHDARIFTRKDGIVIDSFNVTDFRTHKKVDTERYEKIENDLKAVMEGSFQLVQEFRRMKSKWWRIENKFFKRTGKVKIAFEEHDKYTILDVFSPDRLGLLYQITRKLSELGLSIYLAKISTKADDVVDSFYLLDRNNKKVSQNDYEFIKSELTTAIEQIL